MNVRKNVTQDVEKITVEIVDANHQLKNNRKSCNRKRKYNARNANKIKQYLYIKMNKFVKNVF